MDSSKHFSIGFVVVVHGVVGEVAVVVENVVVIGTSHWTVIDVGFGSSLFVNVHSVGLSDAILGPSDVIQKTQSKVMMDSPD